MTVDKNYYQRRCKMGSGAVDLGTLLNGTTMLRSVALGVLGLAILGRTPDRWVPSVTADGFGPAEWSIPIDSPLVALGGSDDPDQDIEKAVVGCGLLRNGRIVVADLNAKFPVRVFDGNGKRIKAFPAGQGPEDFPVGNYVLPFGDSLAIGQ